MKITKFSYPILAWLLFLNPFHAYSQNAVEARKALAELSIPFTRDTFIDSARESDTVVVQLFIEAEMNVNAQNDAGETALMSATKQSHSNIVKLLLTAGADANAKDKDGATALIWAAKEGHADIVKMLLTQDADINAMDASNQSALAYAITNENKAIALTLLNAGADANTQAYALHQAAKLNTDILKALLVAGADINAKTTKWEDAALIMAAQEGPTVAVRTLLDQGADVNVRNSNGDTALIALLKSCYPSDYNYKCLNQSKVIEVIEKLLEVGADVNATTKDGSSALMYASQYGLVKIAEVLIKSGAHPDTTDKNGKTALIWAAQKGQEAIVKTLLDAKTDVNVKDKDGKTALTWAAQTGHVAVVEKILKTAKNLKINEDAMALGYAAWMGHTAVVKALLTAEIDGTAKNWALKAAAIKGHKSIVELLLGAGADTEAESKEGKTALDYAVENGHKEVVQLLRKASVKYDSTKKLRPLQGTSRQIRQAQMCLNILELYHSHVDGVYGPQTEAAIRQYQMKNGLSETGNLDEETQKSLRYQAKCQRQEGMLPKEIMTGSRFIEILDYKKHFCKYHTNRENSVCLDVSYRAKKNISHSYDDVLAHKIIVDCFDSDGSQRKGTSKEIPSYGSLIAGEVRTERLFCPPGTVSFKLRAHSPG